MAGVSPNLTLSQVAARAGVSERTAYAWVKSGKLAAYRVGNNVRVAKEELERFLEERSKVVAY